MATKQAKRPTTDEVIEDLSLQDYADLAFKRYATAVIEDRALPDIYDGLKPVHRRLMYSMYQLHCTPEKEPIKAARVKGDVMGRLHPHGDSGIESGLVSLVNCPTPLVYGHGNWGSLQEPKYAAFRYINCTLTPYGMTLVNPDYLAVAPMMPNYDNKEMEPVVLPSVLPNLFINGSFGIAVGFTNDMLPLAPVGVLELCRRILAGDEAIGPVEAAKATRPQFLYGGELYLDDKESKAAWVEYWKTGVSTLYATPWYEFDEKQRKLWLSGFPGTQGKSANLEKLLNDLREHPQVSSAEDITDVSTTDSAALVEVCFKRAREFEADMYEVVDMCFVKFSPKSAAIQRRHVSVDKVEDIQNRFHQASPLTLLKLWCQLRVQLESRCLAYRLNKVEAATHKTEVLILACQGRDKVVKALTAPDPDAAVAKALSITLDDAKMILDGAVRRLAKLDEDKLIKQLKDQQATIKQLKLWAKNPDQKVIDDLEEAKGMFE